MVIDTQEQQPLLFSMEVTDIAEAQRLADSVKQKGGQAEVVEAPQGISGLEIVALVYGTVTLGYFATTLYEWWRIRDTVGMLLQVDANGKVTTKEMPALGPGEIMVIAKDGTVSTYHGKTFESMKLILTAAVTGASNLVKNLLTAAGGGTSAGEGGQGTSGGGGSAVVTDPGSAESTPS